TAVVLGRILLAESEASGPATSRATSCAWVRAESQMRTSSQEALASLSPNSERPSQVLTWLTTLRFQLLTVTLPVVITLPTRSIWYHVRVALPPLGVMTRPR